MDFLTLPTRAKKNRDYGLTVIADFGTPVGELNHILSDYHSFIDLAKIGIGSAYVTPNLKRKIELYKEYHIQPYCGGTLFEKAYYQGKINDYLKFLENLGIEWVEVSNGTLDIPLEERLELVSQMKNLFHVIGEVGSKEQSKVFTNTQWLEEIHALLDAGCEYITTEGRDSGTAGIYDRDGTVKKHLIDDFLQYTDVRKIIFEAPTPKQQMFFINHIGPNVNLGNVKLQDIVTLEAQRCGLRSETFFLGETKCILS
ncbi:phosphosulfolactate synthase [Thermolongibacillus altinsuensis]|jgi:phosphosulfolactate synthase